MDAAVSLNALKITGYIFKFGVLYVFAAGSMYQVNTDNTLTSVGYVGKEARDGLIKQVVPTKAADADADVPVFAAYYKKSGVTYISGVKSIRAISKDGHFLFTVLSQSKDEEGGETKSIGTGTLVISGDSLCLLKLKGNALVVAKLNSYPSEVEGNIVKLHSIKGTKPGTFSFGQNASRYMVAGLDREELYVLDQKYLCRIYLLNGYVQQIVKIPESSKSLYLVENGVLILYETQLIFVDVKERTLHTIVAPKEEATQYNCVYVDDNNLIHLGGPQKVIKTFGWEKDTFEYVWEVFKDTLVTALAQEQPVEPPNLEDNRSKTIEFVTTDIDGTEKKFYVPQKLLEKYSPVYTAMFSDANVQRFPDTASGSIQMMDSTQSVDVFVNYFHTMNLAVDPSDFRTVFEVMDLANRYFMEHLKTLCLDFVDKILSCDNCLEIMLLAQVPYCKHLIEKIHSCVKDSLHWLLSTQSEYMKNFLLNDDAKSELLACLNNREGVGEKRKVSNGYTNAVNQFLENMEESKKKKMRKRKADDITPQEAGQQTQDSRASKSKKRKADADDVVLDISDNMDETFEKKGGGDDELSAIDMDIDGCLNETFTVSEFQLDNSLFTFTGEEENGGGEEKTEEPHTVTETQVVTKPVTVTQVVTKPVTVKPEPVDPKTRLQKTIIDLTKD